MNSFIKYTPESLNDYKAFIELILSIIDTKLQYVTHRTDTLINTYHSSLSFSDIHSVDFFINEKALNEDVLLANREEVFSLIEQYSKSTNLLLTMRTKLCAANVSRIYDLLSNDHYLLFENEELVSMIKPKKIKTPKK